MAEYKNGVNAFGNMTVSKEERSSEVHTGRAVFVDEDKYANDPDYKLKVDKCLAEGFHRVGESGGGGSSDFSTAQVTVINNTEDPGLSLHIPTICEANELGEGSPAMIYNYMACPLGESTRKVRLYKGLAYCEGAGTSPGTTITVSGNITIENNAALITGDCTITIS